MIGKELIMLIINFIGIIYADICDKPTIDGDEHRKDTDMFTLFDQIT